MTTLWQPVQVLTAIAVILLLCIAQTPVALSGTNGAASAQATTSTTVQVDAAQQPNAKVSTGSMPAAKPKAITKPREKSILDADVLDSPMSYLRNAFSPEEDDMDAPAHSGAVMVMLKALAASLLSTII